MIHLFINALAASAGGGLTYVRNLLPQLAKRSDVQATVVLSPMLGPELYNSSNLTFLEYQDSCNTARRFWHEQTRLPDLIRRSNADVLLSTGNFALRKSPVPQILLCRNSLYTSSDFSRDLLTRRAYAIWLDTKVKCVLAKCSLRWANCTVAPSAAFARDIQEWSGQSVRAIHHGFDHDAFLAHGTPLPVGVERELAASAGALRLLFVSHYNYYRNFETLLRAVPLIRERIAPRSLKLFLTCQLKPGENPGSYRTDAAAELLANLGIQDSVVQLGSIPYTSLHHLYKCCDIYVTPAYTESFAHPLVEAMSCGLPVVASDLSVHREICGKSALFFSRFSEQELADRISQLAHSSELRQELGKQSLERSSCFSWERHTAEIVELAFSLSGKMKIRVAQMA
jgi:glycosyltransferase involved in cell wall biosynthesis